PKAMQQSADSAKFIRPEVLMTNTDARVRSTRSAASRSHRISRQLRQKGFCSFGCSASDSVSFDSLGSGRNRLFTPGLRLPSGRFSVSDEDLLGCPGTEVPFNKARNPFPKASF